MSCRTSGSDPIRVDYLPLSALPLRGRLGLTLAPGKHDESWSRSLEQDVDRLRWVYQTALLVSLVEDRELDRLGIRELPGAIRRANIAIERFPIPDGWVPESLGDVAALARRLRSGVAGGGDGALGRTEVIRADGTCQTLGFAEAVSVAAGDQVILSTPGGGGYGLAEEPAQ